MNTNPLALIPDRVRVAIYLVYAFTSIGLTATLAGYAAIQVVAPVWIVFGLAFLGSLGAAFGFTAIANVKTNSSSIPEPEPEVEDESTEDEPVADESESTEA